MGGEGFLIDLRRLNPGRPSDHYDVFFGHLSDLVEEVSAADERRHNEAHLSQWISLSNMIEMAAKNVQKTHRYPQRASYNYSSLREIHMQRQHTTSILISMCSTKSRADSCASPIQTSTMRYLIQILQTKSCRTG